MIVTIASLGFELRPYGTGPCWQLFELATDRKSKDGEPQPDAWRSTGCYPSNLEHGLRTILERSAHRSKLAGDVRDALAEMQRMTDEVKRALRHLQPVSGPSSAPDAAEPRTEVWE